MADTKVKAPKDVLTTKATQATRCRGRWSQCDGKYQQVSDSWHICHADTALRETAQKAGFTRPGVKGPKRGSGKPAAAPEPEGLSAAKASKPAKAAKPITVSKAAAEADDVPPARPSRPPRPVLAQPIARVTTTTQPVASLVTVK